MIKVSLPTQTIKKFANTTSRYLSMLIFLTYSLLVGLIIHFSGLYSKQDPTLTQVEDRKKAISSKKVDNDAISRLEELESRNISLESLFDNGRNNPFEN